MDDPKLVKVVQDGAIRYKRRCSECSVPICHQSTRCRSCAKRLEFSREHPQPRARNGQFV